MDRVPVANTIWSHIENRANLTPQLEFLVDEQGRSFTFAQYYNLSCKYAAWLTRAGVRPGTRVAWQLPTSVESIMLCSALCKLQAIQVPLLPILGRREIAFMCEQAQVELLLFDGRADQGGAREIFGNFESAGSSLRLEAVPDLKEILAEEDKRPPRISTPLEAKSRWIFYTSGTTADPKGAWHSDSAILSTAMGMNACLELTAGDVVPMVFPFTHIGGVIWLASLVITGAKCLVVERFNEATFAQMSSVGVTVAGAGTTFVQAYIKHQENMGQSPFLANLRCATGGGAAKPRHLHEDVKRVLGGCGYISGYGMTECPIATMNTIHDPDQRLSHTEGRPMPGMLVKIVDPEGAAVAAGVEGEICLKGPHLCLGYVDSALNATAFDSEGYLRTGDLGNLSGDGWLSVTGRLKDIIIRKGENISATRVEEVIASHPAIEVAALVGLPDELRGEMACACIVTTQGMVAPDLSELAKHCLAAGLRRQECPERLVELSQLPLSPSGKVLKEELKRQVQVE